jgi:hypothetical protein
MRSGAVIFGIGLAILLAPPSAARADDVNAADGGDAANLFNRGLADMKSGHYASGCPALASSLRLDPRPGTLFTLAECNLRWGRSASALASYDQYLALYDRMPSEQKVKQGERARIAAAERDQLAPSVPRLSVSVPETAPAGLVVRLDEIVLQGPMLGAATPVDPGEHVVRTWTPDGRAAEQRVTLVDGEQRKVVVELPGAAATPAPGVASSPIAPATTMAGPAPGSSTGASASASHRPWILLAGGVGVAGGVVAGVAGGLALQERSTAGSGCDPTGVCTSQHAVDAGNEARGLANAETVALAVAGVGIVIAVVLWLTESSPPRASAGGGAGVAWGDTGRAATW